MIFQGTICDPVDFASRQDAHENPVLVVSTGSEASGKGLLPPRLECVSVDNMTKQLPPVVYTLLQIQRAGEIAIRGID
jgi:hypothetical protein